MSSDIITNLQLEKEFETSRVIVVKEINNCDSSFIVSCLIGHCIKSNKALLLVIGHKSCSHYQNVGIRMGYNMQKYIDSGLIKVYDLAEETVNLLISDVANSLENLFLKLKDSLMRMQEKYGHSNVIFDGISHLFDLQYTLRQVNMFCSDVIRQVRNCNKSFVLFNCNVSNEDDISYVMANLLSHKAYTLVQVEGLPSGLSADVSGHLTMQYPGRKFDSDRSSTLDVPPLLYLYKLFDKGVKLFAPGTV